MAYECCITPRELPSLHSQQLRAGGDANSQGAVVQADFEVDRDDLAPLQSHGVLHSTPVDMPSLPSPPGDNPTRKATEGALISARWRRQIWISIALAGRLLAYAGFDARARSDTTAIRPEPLAMLDGLEEHSTFSRDGRRLAFTWEREEHPRQIYMRDMNNADALLRQFSIGRDGGLRPVWSPDAARIALVKVPPLANAPC